MLRSFQQHQSVSGRHHRVEPNEHPLDDTALFRSDDVLHFHCFEDHERLPRRNRLADFCSDADDQGLQWGPHVEAIAHSLVLAASVRKGLGRLFQALGLAAAAHQDGRRQE